MTNRAKMTRKALYELVWSEPISKAAPKLGVSDVALSKICRKLDVPKPPRGYWARLAHGKAVHKPALPKAKKGVPTEYEISPPNRPQKASIPTSAPPPRIPVKTRITHYDPVIAELKSRLKDKWTDQYGRIRSRTRVSISKASVTRTCRILDALVRALRNRGMETTIDEHGLAVEVAGEAIRLELHEPSTRQVPRKQSEYGYPRWDYIPSGRLTLSLWSRYLTDYQTQWSDSSGKPLEERLGEVVLLFEQTPSIIAQAKERERREWLVWERAQLCRRRHSDAFKHTKARTQAIDALARNLSKAAEIRLFVKAVKNASSPPAATRRLARWATLYADHLDPLVDFSLPKLNEKPPAWL